MIVGIFELANTAFISDGIVNSIPPSLVAITPSISNGIFNVIKASTAGAITPSISNGIVISSPASFVANTPFIFNGIAC